MKYRLVYSSVATGVAVGIGYFIRHRVCLIVYIVNDFCFAMLIKAHFVLQFARDGDSFLFSIGVRLDNLVPAVATTIFLMVVFYTGKVFPFVF